jgi:hypothetical protein
MSERLSELLDEIKGRVQLLEAHLPGRIDAASTSGRATLPFHTIHCREVLAWRCAELAREAYEAIQRRCLVSGILLTRGVVETVAAQWYLRNKLAHALESKALEDIELCVSGMLLGSRTNPEAPQAINVLNFIDAADKELEGFRHQFDTLCEFAHPNWAGTSLLYSAPDPDARAVHLGRNIRQAESVTMTAAINLSVALAMFEVAYNGIADIMEAFVELCDKQLGDAV